MWLHVILNCVNLCWGIQFDNNENTTTKSSTLKSEKINPIGEWTLDAECGKLVSLEDNKENKKYVGEDVSVKVNFIAHQIDFLKVELVCDSFLIIKKIYI